MQKMKILMLFVKQWFEKYIVSLHPQLGYGVYQFFDHNDAEVTKMFMGWRGLV